MKKFTDLGAFWHHDGNPKRPYARLTSGKISNGFFNGGIVTAQPRLLADVVRTLVLGKWVHDAVLISIWDTVLTFKNREHPFDVLFVGPAMGGITFASRLAEEMGVGATFAEKVDGQDGRFTFKRLPPQDPPTRKVLLTEDTITSGKSVEGVQAAVWREMLETETFPMVVALCNRSGKSKVGSVLRICALIDRHMPTWDEGANPFTPDGKELVEPVRPKTHWGDLTKSY